LSFVAHLPLAQRLQEEDQSDVVVKGLGDLSLANPLLAQPLRLLLAQTIPRQAKSVVFMVPASPQGKVLFNLVRHVLDLRELVTAAAMTIDLQRLQLVSQLIAVVRVISTKTASDDREQMEAWPPYLRLFQCHGVAMLLFPPLLARLFEQTNRSYGRMSAASIRNCLARVHHVAMALCRWLKCAASSFCHLSPLFSAAERLRTPLNDWNEAQRNGLERGAREARNVRRQARRRQGRGAGGDAPADGAEDGEDGPGFEGERPLPSIEGPVRGSASP
jgi:hypothetical protein